MPKKIILRVREEIGCPLFRAGDQMVLDLPGVDRAGSTNICTLAIAKYVVERGEWNCEDMKAPLQRREFLCPRSPSPVLFDVLEHDEQMNALPMMGTLTGDLSTAVATLRTVPVFRSLPAAVLGRLAGQMKIESYKAKQPVVEKGSLGRAFYVVFDGQLEVVDYADQEVSSVVTRLKGRDCFGEMSLLTGAPCAATVVASTDVTLLALAKEDFERLLRENPPLASSFTRLLASRLMSTNVMLVKEGSKTFSGKLQEMTLATVLQVLADSNRSGTLFISDYLGNKGRIAFSTGRLFDAQVGELTGEAAIFSMLKWTKGDFWLDKKAVPVEDKIDCSVMGLLLEGMRKMDEEARGPEDAASSQSGDSF
jgi:CRP/FNR family transcriptional regulator, cyclic AMP receptor protein